MGFSTAGGGSFRTGPQMNVTPLIDVLLVLIIVFMVVVIDERPTGLETDLPDQSKRTEQRIPPPQQDDQATPEASPAQPDPTTV